MGIVAKSPVLVVGALWDAQGSCLISSVLAPGFKQTW